VRVLKQSWRLQCLPIGLQWFIKWSPGSGKDICNYRRVVLALQQAIRSRR